MAQYVNAAAAPDRALTAVLLNDAYAVVATASTVEEVTIATVSNKTGLYKITFATTNLSGGYRLVIVDNLTGFGIASYEAHFSGTNEETINASEYHAAGSTDEKLTTILSKITPLTTVFSAQPDSSSLSIIRGDNFDGISWPKLVFDAGKDLSGVTDINFTIRDMNQNLLISTADAGVSAAVVGTTVEVTLLNSSTSLLPVGEALFDCEVIFTDSHQTIARGCVDTNQDISL